MAIVMPFSPLSDSVSRQASRPAVAEQIEQKGMDVTSSNASASPTTVLCDHCGRTAENGIRCLGMCVADSDY
ncbi:hypothetical protein CWE17_10535 [Synechococcus sp. BS56D]|nr:hypothetical protein CWE17_10535 [Synechococcus sp. BS56D]